VDPLKNRPRLIDRLQLRLSSGRLLDGLWIGTDEDKSELVLEKVEAALRLIKTRDPRRYDRLRRDLSRIWVRLLAGARGSFNASLSACELDARFVLAEERKPVELASVIVHEATHARIHRAGIRYRAELRHRIEAACFREEAAFARTVPDGESVRERAERWLKAPQEYWSDASLEQEFVEGSAEALRQLGVPRWIVVMVRKLRPAGKMIRRLASGLTRA